MIYRRGDVVRRFETRKARKRTEDAEGADWCFNIKIVALFGKGV